jgi:hypothetical protein
LVVEIDGHALAEGGSIANPPGNGRSGRHRLRNTADPDREADRVADHPAAEPSACPRQTQSCRSSRPVVEGLLALPRGPMTALVLTSADRTLTPMVKSPVTRSLPGRRGYGGTEVQLDVAQRRRSRAAQAHHAAPPCSRYRHRGASMAYRRRRMIRSAGEGPASSRGRSRCRGAGR